MSYLTSFDENVREILTLPDPQAHSLCLRATALIFHDPKSLQLLDAMQRIAPSDASALIIGETGTGKELIARRLHELSGRNGPFVAVNCGALTESLAEAELFGHEKGAFTGAVNARAGWFETANGGTLFLDEIGDLPASLQVKLLRVLQEREVVRLGSRKSIPINVRLIAATNVELEQAVASNHFRMDLYYRLNVARLNLLPLRERQGDILPLSEHFLSLYKERMHLQQVVFTPEAEQALLHYHWPGNIRELENVIHYALLVCNNRVVTAENLRLPLRPNFNSPQQAQALVDADPYAELKRVFAQLYENHEADLFEKIQEVLVETAFQYSSYNQVRTAELLGVTRNVIRTLLQRYERLPQRHRPGQKTNSQESNTHVFSLSV